VHGATCSLAGRCAGLRLVRDREDRRPGSLPKAEHGSSRTNGEFIDSSASLHAFPFQSGYGNWVLDYLPRLGRTCGITNARACAWWARRGAHCPARPGHGNSTGRSSSPRLERAFTLAGRLSLRQTEVAAVYGSPRDTTRTPPLTTLAITHDRTGGRGHRPPAEVGWTARRLARLPPTRPNAV